jgi:hypothetical protein
MSLPPCTRARRLRLRRPPDGTASVTNNGGATLYHPTSESANLTRTEKLTR